MGGDVEGVDGGRVERLQGVLVDGSPPRDQAMRRSGIY